MPANRADTRRPQHRPSERRSRSTAPRFTVLVQIGLATISLFGWSSVVTSGSLKAQDTGNHARKSQPDGPESIEQRRIQIPQGSTVPAVVMTEFYTHGELDENGENLFVTDSRHELVPWRVLQAGPGDHCRIAFQTRSREHLYRLEYGKTSEPRKSPAWTASTGLLLETHHWKDCNLKRLDSVDEAFRTSPRYGRAFVPAVFHRENPFWPGSEPFLSEYRGTLRIARPGLFRFFTSSQDASFLLIDGQLVVAAPGRHGPVGDARFQGQVNLTSGLHAFRYVHAAAGDSACMVAAWQPPGVSKPERIPPEAFDSQAIARLRAVGVKHAREFTMEILGEVPLPDENPPLIRARFHQIANHVTASHARVHWDFGDGQTGTQTDPIHVYLHPGLYLVKMQMVGGPPGSAIEDRVLIHRPALPVEAGESADDLASYVAVVAKYDPAKLDATGLLQLVRAFEQADLPARAAKAGQEGIPGRTAAHSESERATVRIVSGLLRDRLDDPEAALNFLQKAAAILGPESWKAECEVEAADIALNDLLRTGSAKTLLDSATARRLPVGDPISTSRLNRVWGDWYARKGDRPSARAAYARAMASAPVPGRSAIEQDAWRGALSRSTEVFLRDRSLDRARTEWRRWQDEFPMDRIEGYLTFLQASYWAARQKYPRAIALAGDLLTINPDSPYADRLVLLAGECEEKLGEVARARARFQALLTDYPGSPLVGDARQRLARLTAARPEVGPKNP